jgi:hypothetical protein
VSTREPANRAARLARWYPATWRERYLEEFTELLASDIAERPRCASRTVDVVRSGLLARLSAAGLVGDGPVAEAATRSAAGWSLAALALCAALGGSIWSQLAISAQWQHPYSPGESVATVVLGLAVAAALVVLATALVIVVASAAGHLRTARVARPLALVAVASAGLVAGAARFSRGWPGLGGHAAMGATLAPRGLAGPVWSATLSVTTYWAHPGALSRFSSTELAWMVASGALIVALAVGIAQLARACGADGALLRALRAVSGCALAVMALFTLGALCWVASVAAPPAHQPSNLFDLGAIDLAGTAAMAGALVFAVAQRRRLGARGYSRSSSGVS